MLALVVMGSEPSLNTASNSSLNDDHNTATCHCFKLESISDEADPGSLKSSTNNCSPAEAEGNHSTDNK